MVQNALIRSLTIAVICYVLVAAASVFWAYKNALVSEFRATVNAGEIRLDEATARLKGQFEALRIVANFLAEDHLLAEALITQKAGGLDEYLKRRSLKYGLWKIDLVDDSGNTFATSEPFHPLPLINSPLIEAGTNGRLGYEIVYEKGQRLVRFSRGIVDSSGRTIGVIIITADLANLEFEWPVVPEPYLFFDRRGISVSSNRPELLLLNRHTNNGQDFPFVLKGANAGQTLWTYHIVSGENHEVLLVERRIEPLRLDALIVLDTGAARSTAFLRMWLVIALFVMILLAAAIAYQQRRRLAIETQHSATLETRVQERTAELRKTQDKLVESSKLAAMGRLSAGLSHELNQPLAAIMNFSQNGQRFLDKSRPGEAYQNFDMISDQVRRMTRIISGLRAFARQETTPTETVDLHAVTAEALDMVAEDLTANNVTVTTDFSNSEILIEGGRVRLQQVILNLISNALDAMQDCPVKKLCVSLSSSDGMARLSFRDTGGGVQDLDRVFEPFYTTKELGSSKGLGMGLALSYGIISRFGGNLSCRNTEQGAEFSISLPTAGKHHDA